MAVRCCGPAPLPAPGTAAGPWPGPRPPPTNRRRLLRHSLVRRAPTNGAPVPRPPLRTNQRRRPREGHDLTPSAACSPAPVTATRQVPLSGPAQATPLLVPPPGRAHACAHSHRKAPPSRRGPPGSRPSLASAHSASPPAGLPALVSGTLPWSGSISGERAGRSCGELPGPGNEAPTGWRWPGVGVQRGELDPTLPAAGGRQVEPQRPAPGREVGLQRG